MSAGPPTTLLSGVETLVRLLAIRHQLDARDGLTTATMVSGYPGSPLGTLDLALEASAQLLADNQIVHRPGLNEELAVATVWGSQMGAAVPYARVDGVAGAWYGKTPGLDRSGDAMKHANAMGAGPNGGAVMICGDDPTAKSSTLPCDSQPTFEDACMPVLYPGDPQDALDLGVHAFRLSRYSGAWVGLKIVTSVADGVGSVDLSLDRHHPTDPVGLEIDGQPWAHVPVARVGPHTVPEQELLVNHRRLAAAKAYVRHNGLDRVTGPDAATVGIVCAGKTYFDVVQALADLGVGLDDLAGVGVRILKLAMTYPVVERTVLDFADSVDSLLVVEEKRPFVETQVRAVLHEAGRSTPLVGKRDRSGQPLSSIVGELTPSSIGEILTREVPALAGRSAASSTHRPIPLLELPPRPPGFCSGCPHNRSTVIPAGALVGGGVGCHGIMYFEARHAGMQALPPTPMGAEGVPWLGLEPFVDEPHLIQNLGDGTLSHSGTLAIRASVAAGADVTFKILYNTAVAMTGGQPVAGLMDVPSLTRALEAEGVRRIVVCAEDPTHYGPDARWATGVRVLDRDELPAVQDELREVRGVTVIVYDQRCAAEARRLRKKGELDEPPRRVFINEGVCEGCGDCGVKSNCLSVLPIDTEFGEKRMIHDPSCNRDYTCLEGDCPSFVTLTPATDGRRRAAHAGNHERIRPSLPDGELPEPKHAPVERQYGVYFTGIGGTGVVTASRIIATAAEQAGLVVGGLDQTGLSQKAGAVVSHLHLASTRGELGAATVSDDGADLYLSGDILQAAAAKHLGKIVPGRTVAVIDDHVTPTAAMLQTDAAPPELDALRAAITEQVGDGPVCFVSSEHIAETVFANHLLANIVLLGAAFQLGGLPMTLDEIEAAMASRGRAGADTREAFEWGRWVAHDRDAVHAALAETEAAEAAVVDVFAPTIEAEAAALALVAQRQIPDALRELVSRRTAQVVDYQSVALAERYLELVERIARHHDDAGHDWQLTRAVLEAWFKLLTYKDEYEVARLHLRVDYDQVAAELGIDGPYEVTYHLHPPTLRRLGMDKKLPMGRTYEAAFRALARMKHLRGTRLDPFGRDPDRKMERALIVEYEGLLLGALASGDLDYGEQVDLATSVQTIKGYGPIKEAAVDRWRADLSRRWGRSRQ